MSKIEVDAIEPQSGTTLTLGASGDSVNIASGATITDFTSTGIDDNATSTAITIDGSENVGIGTASPSGKLDVNGSVYCDGLQVDGNAVIQQTTGDVSLTLAANENASNREPSFNLKGYNSSSNPIINFGDSSGYPGSIEYENQDNSMRLYTNASEAMRIDDNGYVHVGRTSDSASAGITLRADGIIKHVVDGNVLHVLNRLTSDGTLVAFQQAGVEEGNITVSGATVAYNGFTGTHWSRFIDKSKPNILRGTILESLDEMCDWYNLEFNDNDGNTQKIPYVLQDGQSNGDVITYDWNTEKKDENDNDIIEQVQATIVKETDIKHVKSKVSDTVDTKNVYGVFSAYDEDGEGYNDFYVASVGTFVVRIKQGETVAKGDLLQSNGDGTAKVQTDDAIRASTFAKVLSTTVIETYEDGSYLVPCSLMC